MTQQQFISKTKTWISHKLILANKSNWYKSPFKKDAVIHVRARFANFLLNTTTHNAAQLAILVKRHEGLLETLLPIPSNPSYEKSFALFKTLIVEAETIIKTYNLTV